ncbi:MAG: SUMF1/EgtB/PvdO family nonheme iron enzyme [bacterium]|nr:SUMF1/EgtB/PvdO family nonheme iron enzyme [bacterium]
MTTDTNKTVFISYRRTVSKDRALFVFDYLQKQGYDVFIDIEKINSGLFDKVIANQIRTRQHFIVLLNKGSLEGCQNQNDWLRREIEEALHYGRNIIPIKDEDVDLGREIEYLPIEWRDKFATLNMLPWVHYYYEAVLEKLCERFLLAPLYPLQHVSSISVDEQKQVDEIIRNANNNLSTDYLSNFGSSIEQSQQTTSSKIITPIRPSSSNFMPKPFSWIDIPEGKVTILDSLKSGYLKEDTTFNVSAFQIAKYPVTNAQYQLFLDAGGYKTIRWWTKAGFDELQAGRRWINRKWEITGEIWSQPYNWNSLSLNDDNPVGGVSWYEAIAYCKWLSEITGENIMLPTEQQWQRAAQGDDGRVYPWGNEWDITRCNNRFTFRNKQVKTRVIEFENKGDSPFGVVDMAGNISEWCLTHHQSGNISADEIWYGACILRGGAYSSNANTTSNNHRAKSHPIRRLETIGFRLARF